MSNYSFDEIVDRRATSAIKWMDVPEGTIPMTIADMDFPLAPEIKAAVIDCVNKSDFGYVGMVDEDYDAIINWCKRRYGHTLKREHLIATPGVLYTARAAMYAMTEPGDKVIVQPPLHTPSIATAAMKGRIPLKNQLIYNEDGLYTFNYEQLETFFREGAKVLMMCSPNNPTGRVWTYEELENIARIVSEYDGYVIVDEIHRDIVWDGHKHVFLSDMPGIENRVVSLFSTSKTFNMGGFHIGTAEIRNPQIRDAVVKELYAAGHSCGRPSLPCIAAQTAAYNESEWWLDEMLNYVDKNITLSLDYLKDTPIKVVRPQGTFLLWADITAFNLNNETLDDLMYNKLKVLCDPGHYYDTAEYQTYQGSEHHIRINLATSRALVEEAMDRIRKYAKGF